MFKQFIVLKLYVVTKHSSVPKVVRNVKFAKTIYISVF